MTQLELLKVLLNINTTDEDGLLTAYLTIAEQEILSRLYPFQDFADKALPDQYKNLQVRVAEFLYLKQGAEGETTHNENGINRTYEKGYIPETLLMEITPFAKVM